MKYISSVVILFFASVLSLPCAADTKTEAQLRQALEAAKAQIAQQAAATQAATSKAQAALAATEAHEAEIKRLNAAITEANRLASERGNQLNHQVAQAKADIAAANARSDASSKVALKLAAENQANVHAVVTQQRRAVVENATGHAQTLAAVKDSSDAATNMATTQAIIAQQGVNDAHEDARRAQELAKQQDAAARNSNLVQFWGFAAVLAGIAAKLIQDRFSASDLRKKEDIAETRRQEAVRVAAQVASESRSTMTKIHILVNSKLTIAITSALSAWEDLLSMLQAVSDKQVASGEEVSLETTDKIVAARTRIAELNAETADRETQAVLAGLQPK